MSTKDKIYSAYMNYVVRKNKEPKSVAHFCKKTGLSEKKFYKKFKDLDDLRSSIFARFHFHTMKVLHDSDDFGHLATQEKVLIYYFSFFEILNVNRPYVLYATKGAKHKAHVLKQLKRLRKEFITFIQHQNIKECPIPNEKMKSVHDKLLNEAMWGEFMMIFQFWLKDTSNSFEKTDILIEKSLAATFDMFDIEISPSVIDLFKFVYKEAKKGDQKDCLKYKCSK